MHMCAEYTYKCNPGSRFATTHPPPPRPWYGPKTCLLQHSAVFLGGCLHLMPVKLSLSVSCFSVSDLTSNSLRFFSLHVPILCCLMSTLFHLTLPIALLLVGDWMTAIPFPQRPPIPQRGGTGLSLFYLYPKHILLSFHYLVFTI